MVDPPSQKKPQTHVHTKHSWISWSLGCQEGPLEEEAEVGCPWWAMFWRSVPPILHPVCPPLAFGEASFACSGPHGCAIGPSWARA